MKSKSLYLVLMALLTAALPAVACINETGTNQRGEQVELYSFAGDHLKPMLVTPTTKNALVAHAKDVIRHAKDDPSFYNLNNLAAVLIRLGRFPEAVHLLQFLERKFPGNYETASNIGTAYELMGRDQEALKWIVEGMKRNPKDHYGTEWLHVTILKAKLGQIGRPSPGQSILKLDFGTAALPRHPTNLPIGNTGKPVVLFDLALALRYQLLERIQFVDAPDPMVAGLLLDWANLELLAGTVESAAVLYDAALRYGSDDKLTIAARKAQVAKILAQAKSQLWNKSGRCELCEPPRETQ
jgi:tetratricopeptide (TPR) repeat protein